MGLCEHQTVGRPTAWCSHRPISNRRDRKSTRLNSSHSQISYAVFCLKKKKKTTDDQNTYCARSPKFPQHLPLIAPFLPLSNHSETSTHIAASHHHARFIHPEATHQI